MDDLLLCAGQANGNAGGCQQGVHRDKDAAFTVSGMNRDRGQQEPAQVNPPLPLDTEVLDEEDLVEKQDICFSDSSQPQAGHTCFFEAFDIDTTLSNRWPHF